MGWKKKIPQTNPPDPFFRWPTKGSGISIQACWLESVTPRMLFSALAMEDKGWIHAAVFWQAWDLGHSVTEWQLCLYSRSAAKTRPVLMLKNLPENTFLKVCNRFLAVRCISSVSFFLHVCCFFNLTFILPYTLIKLTELLKFSIK